MMSFVKHTVDWEDDWTSLDALERQWEPKRFWGIAEHIFAHGSDAQASHKCRLALPNHNHR